MSHLAKSVFVAAGIRTAVRRGGGVSAAYYAVSWSMPIAQEMAAHAEPDLLVRGFHKFGTPEILRSSSMILGREQHKPGLEANCVAEL